MLNLDYKIERILNGYLITGNDSTKTKRFYSTISEFINAQTEDALRDIEKEYRDNDNSVTEYDFKLKLKAI